MLLWKLEGALQLEEDDSLSSIISDSLLQEARTVLLSPLSHDHFSVLRFALAVPHSLPSFFISPSNSSFLFFHFLQNWANSPHKEAVLTSLTQARGSIQPITHSSVPCIEGLGGTPSFPLGMFSYFWGNHPFTMALCQPRSLFYFIYCIVIYLFIYLTPVPFKARPHYFTWTSAQISALQGSRDGLLPSFHRWENWKLKNVVYWLKVS